MSSVSAMLRTRTPNTGLVNGRRSRRSCGSSPVGFRSILGPRPAIPEAILLQASQKNLLPLVFGPRHFTQVPLHGRQMAMFFIVGCRLRRAGFCGTFLQMEHVVRSSVIAPSTGERPEPRSNDIILLSLYCQVIFYRPGFDSRFHNISNVCLCHATMLGFSITIAVIGGTN